MEQFAVDRRAGCSRLLWTGGPDEAVCCEPEGRTKQFAVDQGRTKHFAVDRRAGRSSFAVDRRAGEFSEAFSKLIDFYSLK